jgi:3-dehydroquinate synthetase
MNVAVKFQRKMIDVIHDRSWVDAIYAEIKKRNCKAMIIFDRNTQPIFGDAVRDIPSMVLSDKQMHKNRACLDGVQEKLFDMQFKKSDILIGIGGGVVQDITAIASACYLGGIDWIGIPTTFNSMVNPTLKGQLNTAFGKNSLTYFYPPSVLVIDTNAISHLTDQNLLVGLAELVRVAASYNATLFERLEKNWVDFFIRDEKLILSFVLPAIKTLYRQYYLNPSANHFGYTMAEAIDWATRYSVPHGIALLLSMEIELNIGVAAGVIKKSFTERVKALSGALLEKYPDSAFYRRKISKAGCENILMPLRYATGRDGSVSFLFPKRIGSLLRKPANVPFPVMCEELNKFFP